jgi:hypothetical protein
MRVVLDCGAALTFWAKGKFGTVLFYDGSAPENRAIHADGTAGSTGAELMVKIHSDRYEGEDEAKYIDLLYRAYVPCALVPARLPTVVAAELTREMAPALTVTRNAGATLFDAARCIRAPQYAPVARRMAVSVLEFILTLHDRLGLVHGDIREWNVLVSATQAVTVCDYHGLQKVGKMWEIETLDMAPWGPANEPPEVSGETYTMTLEREIWKAGAMFQRVFQSHDLGQDFGNLTCPEIVIRVEAARRICAASTDQLRELSPSGANARVGPEVAEGGVQQRILRQPPAP